METYKKIAELRKQYYSTNAEVGRWLEQLEEKYGENFMGWAPTGLDGNGALTYPNILLQGPSTKSLSETYTFNTVNSDNWYAYKCADEIGDVSDIKKINYLASFKITKTQTTSNYFIVAVTDVSFAGGYPSGGAPNLPSGFSGIAIQNDTVTYYTNNTPTTNLGTHNANNIYQIREYYDTQTSSLVLQYRTYILGTTSSWVNMTNYFTGSSNRRLFIGMDQAFSIANSYTVTMVPNI